jgi:hypothetical protein
MVVQHLHTVPGVSSNLTFTTNYLSKVLPGCIRGLGPCGLGSNPSRETSFALVSLVVEVLFCNQGVEVRFLPGAPSLDVIVGTSGHKLLVHDMFRA